MRVIRRLMALALVAGALAPGTWLRSPPPKVILDAGVTATRLPVGQQTLGHLEVLSAWQLSSRHSLFDSYSGLVALGDGQMLAASDRGMALRFTLNDNTPGGFAISTFGPRDAAIDKYAVDIEALTRDPATGRIWAAYEGRNLIERREADLTGAKRLAPAAMKRWPGNSGPEAMVRMADGRFIVLGEGTSKWFADAFPALLWDEDPVAGDAPVEFAFRPPAGFRPTDIAALPDGRVLILARRIAYNLPPHFEVVLLVADPEGIAPGKLWSGIEIARFSPPFPTDNYEGLAVDPGAGYPATITVISDDNGVAYQRTLLLRLQWDGTMPAGSEP